MHSLHRVVPWRVIFALTLERNLINVICVLHSLPSMVTWRNTLAVTLERNLTTAMCVVPIVHRVVRRTFIFALTLGRNIINVIPVLPCSHEVVPWIVIFALTLESILIYKCDAWRPVCIVWCPEESYSHSHWIENLWYVCCPVCTKSHLKSHICTHTGYKLYATLVVPSMHDVVTWIVIVALTLGINLRNAIYVVPSLFVVVTWRYTFALMLERNLIHVMCVVPSLHSDGLNSLYSCSHCGETLKCDMCCAQFATSVHLKSHIRTHIGEQPYNAMCVVPFAQSVHLKSHIRTHTGEKPYKCDTCGAQFADVMSNLYGVIPRSGAFLPTPHRHFINASLVGPILLRLVTRGHIFAILLLINHIDMICVAPNLCRVMAWRVTFTLESKHYRCRTRGAC